MLSQSLESSTSFNCTYLYTSLFSILLTFSLDKDFNAERRYEPEEYDFIIVGGGSAGSVLANRLSEIKEWNVLLLEAGNEEPEATEIPGLAPLLQKTDINWNYRTQPEKNACLKYNGCDWSSGKVMGGTSSINFMLYVRGNQEDYDSWAAQGNPGWSYQDILPYFKKSENNRDRAIVRENPQYHGTEGFLRVERSSYMDQNAYMIYSAFQELGYNVTDINAEHQLGIMNLQMTSINGKRQSANAAFIRPIRRERSNLFIKNQAYVTRILIDSDTKKATGVEYTSSSSGVSQIVKARKEVIVSGGSLHSPQLLMLSGIGPIDELEKHDIRVIQNLSVGYNLQDHITFRGISTLLNKRTSTDFNCMKKLENLYYYWDTNKGPLSATGVSSITVFTRTKYAENQNAPDIQIRIIPNATTLSYYSDIFISPILLIPESRGLIRLNETDPVWGKPLIYPGYLSSDIDINRMIQGVRLALKLFNTTIFRENDYRLNEEHLPPCNQWKFKSDDYWECIIRVYTSPLSYPVGTCKMGPKEDPNAVVDSRLRVYGIKGLRVIDASIMPTIPRGDIYAQTIMIAEKASDMIKQDWS